MRLGGDRRVPGRCLRIAEIAITRRQWAEHPAALLQAIMGHVRHSQPGEAVRRSEQGLRRAAEREVRALVRTLPDGNRKATETKMMIDRLRTFIGYREFAR